MRDVAEASATEKGGQETWLPPPSEEQLVEEHQVSLVDKVAAELVLTDEPRRAEGVEDGRNHICGSKERM